jgi:hypothetical protein
MGIIRPLPSTVQTALHVEPLRTWAQLQADADRLEQLEAVWALSQPKLPFPAPVHDPERCGIVNSATCPACRDRLTRQVVEQSAHTRHRDCGLLAPPCPDCRRTAPLECIDRATCGKPELCRPCAATWRCRIWYAKPIRVRRWLTEAHRHPALATLGLSDDEGADVIAAFRRIARREVRRLLHRELPEAVEYLLRERMPWTH